MVTLQSVQGHTGLLTIFNFFDIRALSDRVPACQKTRKAGSDQYGTERFGRVIFATIRKSVGLKGLIFNVS